MRRFVWLLAVALLFRCGSPLSAKPVPQTQPIQSDVVALPQFFRTLVNPQCSHCNIEAERRAHELRDDDRVLAWTRGKYDGGAVPLRFFLAPYRVISDSYGVWVYDADAGFLRGYQPSYDFSFYGWRDGVMVIRDKDGTLFSALSGVAFEGPRKGQRLEPLATIPSDWGHWLRLYPHTVAYNMFPKYQAMELPVNENAQSLATRGKPDARLAAETPVVGVFIQGGAKAYRLPIDHWSSQIITDRIDGQQLVVLMDGQTRAAAAYAPEVEGSTPALHMSLAVDAQSPDAPFVDAQTHSHWGVEGRAVNGPLKGKTLRWLDSVQCKWFAWSAEYPGTQLDASAAPGRDGSVKGE